MEKSIKYEIAMAETLHYLKGIRKEDIDKIPKKLIKFLQENALKDYECKFDYKKPLNELELKEETKGLIAMICLNYWCQTEEQKKTLIKRLNENEKKYQEELREKYNPDKIFKKEQNIDKEETYALVEYKEKNIIKRVLDKIKSFLRTNKYKINCREQIHIDVLIQPGTIEDIDEIIKLKKDVWNKMENKDWYEIETENKEFLENQLENNGLVLKAVKDNKIIGFLIVENNINKERDIIKNMNLEKEANKCIEFCSVAVDSKYRGNHLYTQMAKIAEKFMIDKYDIKYILATVHPDNIASVKSLLNIGYDICCKTKMYGNKDRIILMKSID